MGTRCDTFCRAYDVNNLRVRISNKTVKLQELKSQYSQMVSNYTNMCDSPV
jgi:hypothetical protein